MNICQGVGDMVFAETPHWPERDPPQEADMMTTHATRLATLLSIGLASCASSNCEKRSIASTDSPDAKYSVVVYTLDCGATAATATHVA